MIPHLNSAQLMQALHHHRGLIPVDLEVDRQRLVWMDLQQYHCYAGFFHRALKMLRALQSLQGHADRLDLWTSDIHVLQSPQLLRDPIYPTGFLFHAGRCGSTLLTKVLARSRRHLVFGEAAPHNHIWPILTNNWHSPLAQSAEAASRYKHLLLAMGRQRLATHQKHFIKFTSFNILFFDFIHSIFPDVPALFLYRNPADILASLSTNPPGWLSASSAPMRAVLIGMPGTEVPDMEPMVYTAQVLQNIFSTALRARAHGLQYLAYDALTPSNLSAILQAFQLTPPPDQLLLMQSSFRYDAKRDERLCPFPADHKVKQLGMTLQHSSWVPSKFQQLYAELTASAGNICASYAC